MIICNRDSAACLIGFEVVVSSKRFRPSTLDVVKDKVQAK
jgi:hypothetical protein